MSLPRLAITTGDPAGIGPEVIVGAWGEPEVHRLCRPMVVGDPPVVRRAAKLSAGRLEVDVINCPREANPTATRVPCLAAGSIDVERIEPGVISADGGQAAYEALLVAAELALSGQVDGLVTAPLHKAALHAAGHQYPGHTELLAELCGARRSAMMLYLPPSKTAGGPAGLGVVHVTLHTALRTVFEQLTTNQIIDKIALVDEAMRRLGVDLVEEAPRIGVCALNPHAGEHGLFGDEERRIIAPAITRAQTEGFNAAGPFPTDTLMVRARDGEFDAVVAMYHDQGHIAIKMMGMHRAVNITLGLPIVRTSVAHGTAFDRAWQGTAIPTGMVEAIRVASILAERRQAAFSIDPPNL